MKIDKHIERLVTTPSAIREIINLVDEYRLHPDKYPRPLIFLAGGWPADTPPRILRKITRQVVQQDTHTYTKTRGLPELLEGIVAYEELLYGRYIDTENILVGMGSTELTMLILMSFMTKHSNVVLSRPYFINYPRQILSLGRDVTIRHWCILNQRTGQYDYNEEILKQLIDKDTSIVLLCSPNNPDGHIYSSNTIKTALDLCIDNNALLVLDLAYRAFCYTKIPAYLSWPVHPNILYLLSFSKELKLCGWRVGYILGSNENIAVMERIQQARTLCPNRLTQMILNKCFSSKHNIERIARYLTDSRQKYARAIVQAHEELKRISKPVMPMGGFYVFTKIATINDKQWCDMILRESQVAMVPGSEFGMSGYVRVSIAPVVNDMDRLREAINRIQLLMKTRREM